MIIGICGKSGSGKSTLSLELSKIYKDKCAYLGIDEVGHHALENDEVKRELIQSFGKEIITQGNVSRKRLGEIVFASRNEMNKLSDITWKYMEKEIDEFIDKNKDKIIILDWLLLPLTKFFYMCDIRILLDVPYKERKKRAIKRDNITEEEFDLRESSSIDYKKEDFHFISDNSKDLIGKVYRLI